MGLKRILGLAVGPSEYAPEPSVVGSVEQSKSGNTVLRVGKATVKDGDHPSWTQTEYVVMKPEEREELIEGLEAHRTVKVIEVGDTVGLGYNVVAVQYLNATAVDGELRGTILAYADHKREWAVLTAFADGTVNWGTYTGDQQRALNAYAVRIIEHLYPHFNASPPSVTFARVADRDKLGSNA